MCEYVQIDKIWIDDMIFQWEKAFNTGDIICDKIYNIKFL